MKLKYINIYNNLIKLTRNKSLYENININETFSMRLIIFLMHFAFFLKIFKNNCSKKTMQEIYDFIFRQIETSIREIGYGDVSINKKMKDYLNIFYKLIENIDKWKEIDNNQKKFFLEEYIDKSINTSFFINYFDKYESFLEKNSLNSFSKDILEPKI
tara:strand:- start:254 stop:727 length:474 start_codon:yes stop_codon:yes gene_type:complete